MVTQKSKYWKRKQPTKSLSCIVLSIHCVVHTVHGTFPNTVAPLVTSVSTSHNQCRNSGLQRDRQEWQRDLISFFHPHLDTPNHSTFLFFCGIVRLFTRIAPLWNTYWILVCFLFDLGSYVCWLVG